MKRIHLLKPGTFVGKDGKSYTFTGDDIRSIAKSYNAQLSEAPIVIGHPDETAPAMGWIASAEAVGDDLFVTPTKVQPAFSEAVQDSRFTKVTASLYSPEHPANPSPGSWYLQHVGFLGAQAPAVKGLQPIQFADGGTPAVIVSLSEGEDEAVSLLKRLTVLFSGRTRNPQLSEAAAAIVAAADPSVAPPKEADVADKEKADLLAAENATLRQQLADANAASAAAALATRKAEVAQFVESAVQAGKLLPAEKGLVIELATRIEAGTTVQLSEGGAQVSLLDSFKAFVTSLPKRGPTTGEHATRNTDVTSQAAVAQFASPAGTEVNAERLEIHHKATQYMAAHPNVDYVAAVRAVEAAG